jgi:hypothetical protein
MHGAGVERFYQEHLFHARAGVGPRSNLELSFNLELCPANLGSEVARIPLKNLANVSVSFEPELAGFADASGALIMPSQTAFPGHRYGAETIMNGRDNLLP